MPEAMIQQNGFCSRAFKAELSCSAAGLWHPAHFSSAKLVPIVFVRSPRLIRVQGDYYNWTLEKRRETLQADSVEKLCKTIVMENTKATDEDMRLEGYSRYWLVCVQYCRKLNAEKLKHYLAAQWKDKIPKRRLVVVVVVMVRFFFFFFLSLSLSCCFFHAVVQRPEGKKG